MSGVCQQLIDNRLDTLTTVQARRIARSARSSCDMFRNRVIGFYIATVELQSSATEDTVLGNVSLLCMAEAGGKRKFSQAAQSIRSPCVK